jgi:hypothetical protein
MNYSLRNLLVVVVLLAFFSPALYVLSWGPVVVRYYGNNEVGPTQRFLICEFYRPLTWAKRECRPLDDFLDWYSSFWMLPLTLPPGVDT